MTKYKIYHLDDSVIFLEQVKWLINNIEKHHHDIQISCSSFQKEEQVYSELEKNLPDLLISDLMLHDDFNAQPGVDFVKKVHKDYPDLRIMVLSAREDDYLQKELKQPNVYYQVKKIHPRKFQDKIIKFLKE